MLWLTTHTIFLEHMALETFHFLKWTVSIDISTFRAKTQIKNRGKAKWLTHNLRASSQSFHWYILRGKKTSKIQQSRLH